MNYILGIFVYYLGVELIHSNVYLGVTANAAGVITFDAVGKVTG